MKQRNRYMRSVIAFVLVLAITGCSANNSDKVVSTSDMTSHTQEEREDVVATFHYDNFASKQKWKYGVLLGDGQILSFDTPLYCTDMAAGVSSPLCEVEGCTHNTSDCQAIFDEHYGCDFVYCYNEKLYAASVLSNCIRITCASANESTHEVIAYDVLEGDIHLSGYYVYEDKLYIGASVEDANIEPLQEGDGSYKIYMYSSIYRFDFATGELDLVYCDEKGDYGTMLEILYANENLLYFDYGESNGMRMALDVAKEMVTEVEGYDDGYYLGCQKEMDYYAVSDENGYQTGEVIAFDKEGNRKSQIQLKSLPKDESVHCDIHLLENGFVVNEQSVEEETGTMTFYDRNGKKIDVVEDCSYYVIGEHQGFYLLGENTYSGVAFAYAKMEEVKLTDSKERNRRMVELHPWE